jgi:hypothetical protein
MRYLILVGYEAFYTNWFDAENNYAAGMVVFDLINHTFTNDGTTWNEINEDHL